MYVIVRGVGVILSDLLLAFRGCQLFLFLKCISIAALTEQFIGVAGKLLINILKSGHTQLRLFRAYVSYFSVLLFLPVLYIRVKNQ